MSEWPVSYEWPRLLRPHGSRGGGKTQDQVRWSALQRLLADARKQVWEARCTSSIVARAFDVGISERLEEAEALLLAVTGLLQQNQELTAEVQRLTNTAPIKTTEDLAP